MSNSSKKSIKLNDRVRRINQGGCYGTVKDVREEAATKIAEKDREASLLIHVNWDNGTLSYMTPEALEVIDA